MEIKIGDDLVFHVIVNMVLDFLHGKLMDLGLDHLHHVLLYLFIDHHFDIL